MVLKLYGDDVGYFTRLVAFILYEKNVPFEFHRVDLLRGDQRTWEYKKKQPFGLVPYIDDDGFLLYEARAICYYIVVKYADQGTTNLIPSELKANALYQQAASMEAVYFAEYAEKAIQELLVYPLKGLPTIRANFEAAIAELSAKLEVYDQILGKQRFLAGDEITLADLFHVPMGVMIGMTGSDIIEAKPNVRRWFAELTSRPAWQAVKGNIQGLSPKQERLMAHL
ncbi:glutathione S-transferase [Pholiota conissans]|uniref:glutathione transferase n=1 Tax=Pholiota conissans TaxID=109636 RepID=A0A9P5Z9G2_9AGAR|nr:glutathione S-transferase [Pholiota conissans]